MALRNFLKLYLLTIVIHYVCFAPVVSLQDNKKAKSSIKYYAYTRSNPEKPVAFKLSSDSIVRTGLNLAKNTTISIHDLRGNRENEMNQLVVSSNLKAQDANVIVIDYSKLINLDQPLNVAATAPIVAEAIYDLVSLLKSKFNLELSLLHLVGYDLGGQIAGLCGQLISANYKEKVAHITALDPIGIIYTLETDADERLSPDDAIFVEVVHTNAGGQGFEGSCGHADYYPNGGLHQPGCNEEDECSHQRAYELVPDMWVPVRDHELFLAKCDSEDEMNDTVCRLHNLIMGDLQNGPLSGVYYLETTSKRPFGKGPKRQFW